MGSLLTLLKCESLLKQPHPFLPMTNEFLKKLTRINLDSDQTIKSPKLPAVFETQEPKSILELNPQRSETNQSIPRTNNRY
jgi:hypothetical protein